jgi:hypothetical protein
MIAVQTALQPAGSAPRSGRLLHILDLENLVGSADFSTRQASDVYRAYVGTAPAGLVNQLVIATSHHAAAAAWFGMPANARRLVRSGQDGADLALLKVLTTEPVASRYDQIVIGSGDGIFAEEAARLQVAGASITVVTRYDSLSRRLRLAVRDIRYLDPITDLPAAALRVVAA